MKKSIIAITTAIALLVLGAALLLIRNTGADSTDNHSLTDTVTGDTIPAKPDVMKYGLPIEEFIGRKDDWKGTWEYEKMINAYNRVRKATGIPAGQTNRN